MPVAVMVTPDPVEMPVATMVKPLMFPYKNVIMMVFEFMQRFVMFNFDRCRCRVFWFWGSLYAGQTHDTGQDYNSHDSCQHFLHINYLPLFYCLYYNVKIAQNYDEKGTIICHGNLRFHKLCT